MATEHYFCSTTSAIDKGCYYRNIKCLNCALLYIAVKAKAIPLQAWTGPEGTRRLRLPDFKTFGT